MSASSDYDNLIETLSNIMPPEDQWYSNPDGSEVSEVMAFVEEAAVNYAVIYAARERGEFESDDTLVFGLGPGSAGRVLVEFDIAAHDVALTEKVKAEGWDEGFKQGGPMHDEFYGEPDRHKINPYRFPETR